MDRRTVLQAAVREFGPEILCDTSRLKAFADDCRLDKTEVCATMAVISALGLRESDDISRILMLAFDSRLVIVKRTYLRPTAVGEILEDCLEAISSQGDGKGDGSSDDPGLCQTEESLPGMVSSERSCSAEE